MSITGALGLCEWPWSTIRLCDVDPHGEEESVRHLSKPGAGDMKADVSQASGQSPPSPEGLVIVRPAEMLMERRARASLLSATPGPASASQRSQSRRKSSTAVEAVPKTELAAKKRPRRRQSTGRENVEPGDQIIHFLDDLDLRAASRSRPDGLPSRRPSSTGTTSMLLKPGHKNPQVGMNGLQKQNLQPARPRNRSRVKLVQESEHQSPHPEGRGAMLGWLM